MVFAHLCPGTHYSVVVRYTDADGFSGVAAPATAPGVTPSVVWWGGDVTTPQKYLHIKAQITISTPSSFNANWGVLNSWLYLDGNGFVPRFPEGAPGGCFASAESVTSGTGDIVLPLKSTYVLTQDIDVESDYYWDTRRPACNWYVYNTWRDHQARTLTVAQLSGDGIVLESVPQTTGASGRPDPFTYQIKIAGELQDSPDLP